MACVRVTHVLPPSTQTKQPQHFASAWVPSPPGGLQLPTTSLQPSPVQVALARPTKPAAHMALHTLPTVALAQLMGNRVLAVDRGEPSHLLGAQEPLRALQDPAAVQVEETSPAVPSPHSARHMKPSCCPSQLWFHKRPAVAGGRPGQVAAQRQHQTSRQHDSEGT